MPIKKCISNNKQGFKFGGNGKCFIGKNSMRKAIKQEKAVFASGYKGKWY